MNALDRRIKTEAERIGMPRGLPVDRCLDIGTSTRFEDVLAAMPEAGVTRSNGLVAVDAAKLGLQMKVVHQTSEIS